MLKKENLKSYIDELIKEVEKELDESNATGNVDGYQTPFAFSGKNASQKRKKTATQLGYTIVNNDVENIDESVSENVIAKDGKVLSNGKLVGYYEFDRDSDSFWIDDVKKGKGQLSFDTKKEVEDYFKKNEKDALKHLGKLRESVNEGKSKRPVNRWLELKNDESMHANKKLAVGLKELKHQLSEVEKFFRWYNQIKTMNELSSNVFWKRTHNHIYKIKERLINIAKTIQEIEK